MDHDGYLELLALSLDGELTQEERRALEEHLAHSPASGGVGAQLAALQESFKELEEFPAPEGFSQGVMERIRAEKPVIPLFRRPRFRALAGLAACAVLAVGLYGVSSYQKRWDEGSNAMMVRSFAPDCPEEDTDLSVCEALYDGEETGENTPAYTAPEEKKPETAGKKEMVTAAGAASPEKSVRDAAGSAPSDRAAESVENGAPAAAAVGAPEPDETVGPAAVGAPELDETVGPAAAYAGAVLTGVEDEVEEPEADPWPALAHLVLDRMPQGAEELIPPETQASPANNLLGMAYQGLTLEQLEQIRQLAEEQDIGASRSEDEAEDGQYILLILNCEAVK